MGTVIDVIPDGKEFKQGGKEVGSRTWERERAQARGKAFRQTERAGSVKRKRKSAE